ncbi:hypothetical protein [Nocardia barduliensis]|uniref:hypothetical protein n=1 Tax=Nocardia barduliensis TaxID=2736643 RepID=UPI00157487DD|nr:hypothetical protein [Nocardia barduliensis]
MVWAHERVPVPETGRVPTRPGPMAGLAALQRSAGNGAVSRLLGQRPSVQRQNLPGGDAATAGPALSAESERALSAAGLLVTDEDKQLLARGFPQGFTVGAAQPVILGMRFGDRFDGARVTRFEIRPAPTAQVQPGVQAFFFQPDAKGRAVLLSSIGGGGSIQFDAGAGNSFSATAPAVRRLVQSIGAFTQAQATVPQLVVVSHADADHYNAVRPLLTEARFSATAVEVTLQQLRTAEAGAWKVSSLTVQPGQQVVEINVGGTGGVHVQRRIIGNMELTTYRSVAAHAALTQPGARFNRNASSPVVVMHDMVSGERMLFTADADGRQFTEIVTSIGADAFRRMLGGPGRNLRLMEVPHHFGEQAGADNTAGFLRMLELAYESGGDALRLVSQTTQSFAQSSRQARSRTFTFLDTAGLSPEAIHDDPSPPGQAQATRATGGRLERVTVDMAGLQLAAQEIERSNTLLRSAYGGLAEIADLRAGAESLRAAYGASAAPGALTGSVTATEAGLDTLETTLRASTARYWAELHAAATAAGGVNSSANLAQATAALAQLGAQVQAQRTTLARERSNLEGHQRGMNLYQRMHLNAVQMIAAVEAENVDELLRCRAVHTELMRNARDVLGSAVVDEHVRSAMTAVRAEWTPELERATAEGSARLVRRRMSAELRSVLAESLARQMQLNQLAERAMHGVRQEYRPDGTVYTPVRTRVGGAVLLGIEVVRIGLDVADSYRRAAEAETARTAVSRHTGVATWNWWMTRGVEPDLGLVKRSSWSGWNRVQITDQSLIQRAARSDQRPVGVPEFDMVVITAFAGSQLRRLLLRMIAELTTLADWHAFNSSLPDGPAFERFDNGWAVRAWSDDDDRYSYFGVDGFEPGLSAALDQLHHQLEAGQQNRIDEALLAAGPGRVRTARHTTIGAIFGSDREVLVYNAAGRLQAVNFDDTGPRLLHRGRSESPANANGPLEVVAAADMPTYRRLSQFFWVTRTGRRSWDSGGNIHDEFVIASNGEARAYVRPGELVALDGPDPYEEARRRSGGNR